MLKLSDNDILVSTKHLTALIRRHDTQYNDTQHSDIQHKDTQHKGLICDTQHKGLIYDTQHKRHSSY
jgi:hypothetical protein